MIPRSSLIALLVSLVATVLLACPASADDWPQWRGPNRDGISKEKGLLMEWPKAGPNLLWTFDKGGIGYSAPAVVGDTLYSLGAWDKDEYVYAVDIKTGARKWATKLGPMFDWPKGGNNWNAGPNATPCVDVDLIFALSGNGDLVCVDRKGTEKWRKNMDKDLGGEVNNIGGAPAKIGWGWTWSPLVDGDRLICVPGGKKGLLAALDKKTGDVIWQSKEVADPATYSSPIAAKIGGVSMYIQLTNKGVYGFDPASGKKLWFYEKEDGYKDVVIPTPTLHKDMIFVTAGFNAGSDMIKLKTDGKALKAESAVDDKRQETLDKLDNREGGVVIVDGFLFGHFEHTGLVCVDLESVQTVWASPTMKRGATLYADGKLYYYNSETAEVMLIEASTKKAGKFSDLVKGQFAPPKKSALNKANGRNWTHPVIADGKLYIRDQELLFCYEIK